jgi:hypothetical protein
MYKARIAKWGLDKKTKEAEAWALLRIKMQRGAIGKDSAFRVREKPVTVEDILRYFKRKGIMHPEVMPQPCEASTPPAIECWTPIPSPKPGMKTIQVPEEENVQSGADLLYFRGAKMNTLPCKTALDSIPSNDDIDIYLNTDQTRQILFSGPKIQSFEIPYSPLPPQSLLVPEKLFASIKAYYGGAIDSGLFKTNKRGHLRNVNEILNGRPKTEFYELGIAGANLMRSKSFVEGRRCFSKAFGLVSDLLQEQHPRTMEYILEILFRLKEMGQDEISTQLRILVHGMALTLFAEGDPWRQLLSQIGDLKGLHFEHVLPQVWRCVCDLFAKFLGQFHQTTLLCYTSFISNVHSSKGAAQLLHDYLMRAKQELGEFDRRLIDVGYWYGRALHEEDRVAEAIAILKEGLDCCRGVDGQEHRVVDALEQISQCQRTLGHDYEAESTLRQAIRTTEETYGKSAWWVLQLKASLEIWLREWGREAEAAVLRAEMDEILGPDDI